MEELTIQCFGGLRASLGGTLLVGFHSSKAQALLCYLAVTERPHSRSALAGLLWQDLPEADARANLRKVLSNLRRLIGPHLVATRHEVRINQDALLWLDVRQFEKQVTPGATIQQLDTAVSLYQGDFLQGFDVRGGPAFEQWSLYQRARLRELAVQALDTLTLHFSMEEDFASSIRHARHLLHIDPWREETHRQLIILLAQTGQRTAALRQYEICQQLLWEELGVRPSTTTRKLYETIANDELEQIAVAPLHQNLIIEAPKESQPRHNLPTQTVPFVAREEELAGLANLMSDPDVRLVTILGIGGSGKTRLALAAAEIQLEHFEDGLYFVSLASLDHGEAIAPTVNIALDVPHQKDRTPLEQLLDFLHQKHMLLVMDNFEHLVDHADIIVSILNSAPGVKVLVTSRIKLGLQGEYVFPIVGMTHPKRLPQETSDASAATGVPEDLWRYGAVKLFLQSARRAYLSYEATDEDLPYIAEICRLTEGMPLAILLAAAWTKVLSPREIADHISQSLDFLATDLQDVPRRHRSMPALLDSTWNLMSNREQLAFAALTVFRNGFTMQGALSVAGASLRELSSLVDKSLLNRDASGRFSIHELLRQYGAEKLSQSSQVDESVRDAHCAFYCAFLREREGELRTNRQPKALADLEAESENMRAAWKWAVEQGRVQHMSEALETLATYYHFHGRYKEGEEVIRLALEKAASKEKHGLLLKAKMSTWRAIFNLELGHTELAGTLARQSLDLLDALTQSGRDIAAERAKALYYLGFATLRHDYIEARRLWHRSLELYEDAGDQWGMAEVHGHQAMIAWEQGRYENAKGLIEKNLAIQQALGNKSGIADMYSTLGWIALTQGEVEQAEKWAEKCRTYYQEAGDQARVAKGLRDLAAPKIFLGRFAEADSLLEESIAVFNSLGGSGDMVFTNILSGVSKAHLGRYGQARSRLQLSLELARKFQDQAGVGRALLWLGRIALVEEAYAESRSLLEKSEAIFREVGQKDQRSAALATLGYSARATGNLFRAHQYTRESLQTAVEIGAFLPLLFAIPVSALLAADAGKMARAVELYALASRFSYVAHSRWYEELFGQHIGAVPNHSQLETATASQEGDKLQRVWAAAKELLVELA